MRDKRQINRINGSQEHTDFEAEAEALGGRAKVRYKGSGPSSFARFALAMVTAATICWIVFYFATQAMKLREFKKPEAVEQKP